MIQVSIPAAVPLKEFDYNAEAKIINLKKGKLRIINKHCLYDNILIKLG